MGCLSGLEPLLDGEENAQTLTEAPAGSRCSEYCRLLVFHGFKGFLTVPNPFKLQGKALDIEPLAAAALGFPRGFSPAPKPSKALLRSTGTEVEGEISGKAAAATVVEEEEEEGRGGGFRFEPKPNGGV